MGVLLSVFRLFRRLRVGLLRNFVTSWRTTPCRLSATAYSSYSQLPSIPGGRLLHPQPEDAEIGWDGMGWYGMDWVDVAQDKEQWRTPVNTVMNLRVP
jgi:hypothetical protein